MRRKDNHPVRHDIDNCVEVDFTVERPVFSDRGDSAVSESAEAVMPPPEEELVPSGPLNMPSVEEVSSRPDLMASAGINPVYTTSEAAEFFDRTNQWLYWGLRNHIFTDDDGNPLNPETARGRRKFTLSVIEDIMKSSYRRGNIDQDHLKIILRRIRYAQNGIEWRERESWHYTHLGRNRYRWMKPEDTVWSMEEKQWVPRRDQPKKKRGPKKQEG